MGAWGIGLYQDDTALDVRDTIENGLRLGKPIDEIVSNLKESYY